MNNKLIISRFALSTALLISVVASPTISNAANEVKTVETQTLHKTISIEGSQGISVVNSFTNPLDLAKKYAPSTLEDWTKTLALYEKTIGATVGTLYSSIEVIPSDPSKTNTVTLTTDAKLSTAIAVDLSAVEVTSIDKSHAKAMPMNTLKSTAVVDVANDSDMAFIRAEIELAKAVQAEDPAAIKQSLSKLLEQYKQQIAQWEAAE